MHFWILLHETSCRNASAVRLNRSIVASASFSVSTCGSVIHGYLVSLTWPGMDLLHSQHYDVFVVGKKRLNAGVD